MAEAPIVVVAVITVLVGIVTLVANGGMGAFQCLRAEYQEWQYPA